MTPEQVEIFHNLSGSGTYTLSLNSTKPAKYETDGITTNEVIDSLQDYFFQDLPEPEEEKKETKSTPTDGGSASTDSSDSEQPSSTPNAHEGVYGFFDENNQAFYVTPDNPNYEEIKSQFPIGQEYDSADAASKEGFSPYQLYIRNLSLIK